MSKYLGLLMILLLAACAKEKTPLQAPPLAPSPGSIHEEQLGDCTYSFPKSGLCAHYSWETLPTEQTEGSFILKIFRPNHYDQTAVMISPDPAPSVLLWMPSMGHSSSPTQTDLLDVGTYRVSHVYFIMPGNWQIRIQLKSGTLVQDEATIAVTQ